MATIFAANESQVKVNNTPIEGVRSFAYRKLQARESIYALGSAERIGVVSGAAIFEGQLRVASASQILDKITAAASFQVLAVLRYNGQQLVVTLDECFLMEKNFDMGVGSHGESVYSFTATRVREE